MWELTKQLYTWRAGRTSFKGGMRRTPKSLEFDGADLEPQAPVPERRQGQSRLSCMAPRNVYSAMR
jgi:hypothetical protein